jgi:hypothetical protein
LLIVMPVVGCERTSGRDVQHEASVQCDDVFDGVLKVAVSGAAGNLDQLRAKREQTTDDGVRDFIDVILNRWDETKRTYISPRPVQVERECLHLTAEDRYTIRTATQIAFNVEVDESGHPVSVEPFGGTKDPELARRVKESIAQQRFVPAHDESGLKRGKLTVVCRIEVR